MATIIPNNGVKYIKLAKFDTGSTSENLTTQLGEINTIRVNYSDKGIVEYPVASIVEHETYYLYRVSTTDATSSADNKQLDYNFISARNPLGLSLGYEKIKNYNFESDPLNYFTSSEGDYLYGDTPNKNLNIQYTASFIPDGGNLEGSISIIKQNNLGITSSLLSQQFQENANFTISQSININPIEGEKYFSVLNIDTIAGSSPSLDDFKFKISTGSAYTTSTGTQLPVVLEPFFSEPFFNGDYDVLVNNAQNARSSNLFFDIDYSDNIIQAVNQQVLISSSQQGKLGAPYARIQDYNYYIDRSLTPRYKGSRITKDAINSISSSKSVATQSLEPGQNLGVDTSGQPIVESLNVAAYSINWAGGTSPEILGAGGTSLSDILLVGDNRDDITIVAQADPNYSDIINSSVEPGDIVSFYQYGNSSAQNPQRVEVIETKLNVPPKSAYIVPSIKNSNHGKFTSSLDGGEGIVFHGGGGSYFGIYKVDLNDNGFYISGSQFSDNTEFIDEFESRFNNSTNDWYVTTYNTLGSPVIYNGSTATENYEFTSEFTTSDPLGYYGVSKITEVVNGSVKGVKLDRSVGALNNATLGGSTGTVVGILIWESWGNSIIVRGSNLSGVGASLVYSEFAPKALTENLDYISRTYTNKS